jgi:hypothetical protein
MTSVTTKPNQTALIAAQAATATAVMQDGYDAGGNVTYAGVNRGLYVCISSSLLRLDR